MTRTGRRFSILFAAIAALAKTGSAAARREFLRSARVLAAVALLALFGALALPTTAEAQSAGVLVSNLGQTSLVDRGSALNDDFGLAQSFSVPSGGGDYSLTSIEIRIASSDIFPEEMDSLTVDVWSTDSSGHPASSLHTLTNPTSIELGTVATFAAPMGATLQAGTTYVLVVYLDLDISASQAPRWDGTDSGDEDATSMTGWTIADTGLWRRATDTSWSDRDFAHRIRVNGTAVGGDTPPPPSTDATLSGLSLGTGVTLDPAFAPGTTSYTAAVANSVDEVTVTPTTTDTNATPEFLDASDTTLDDADDVPANGHQVALAVGDTVFKVQVTAEDGTTTQTYTVTVTRAAADTPTCTLNTGDIWCGVVTPASHLVNGVAFAHGFVDDTPDTGALSDKEFSVVTDGVTNSYTIVAVALGVGNATGSLSFSLTSALTAADAAKLVLHVDGSSDQFAFSVSDNPYLWPGTDLDWSSGDPVTLRLRDSVAVPTDAPTDFTATVGDAQVALAWKAARLYSGVTGHEFRYKTDGDYPEDWTAIAYSGPDEANEDGSTVTGLTNEVAHTFELRAVNTAGGGAAATAGPVTPTPGICDRTQKIQDAILAEISGVDDCAAVTVANLASIVTFGPFGLNTTNQGITSLQKGDFAGLTSLTILNLGSNGLTSLPEGIFSGLAELADLNLSSNQLESLPEGAFSGLTALQILYMSNNNLSSLPEDLFSGLTALTNLSLVDNDLSSLPKDLFSGLTGLDSLDLNDNDLDSLPGTVFSGLTALIELDLDDNKLTMLPEGLFSDLTALNSLELNNNALESLPEGLFSGLTALTRLELHNSALESLPEGLFSDLTALIGLELHNNALDSLPEGLFSGLTALSRLLLYGNPTNPMELTVTVEKVGTNQVRAKVLAGAPLAAKRPDGMWFSPTPYLRSRIAFSISAWQR